MVKIEDADWTKIFDEFEEKDIRLRIRVKRFFDADLIDEWMKENAHHFRYIDIKIMPSGQCLLIYEGK